MLCIVPVTVQYIFFFLSDFVYSNWPQPPRFNAGSVKGIGWTIVSVVENLVRGAMRWPFAEWHFFCDLQVLNAKYTEYMQTANKGSG